MRLLIGPDPSTTMIGVGEGGWVYFVGMIYSYRT